MVGTRTQPGRLRKVQKSVSLLQGVGCVDSKRKDWQELFQSRLIQNQNFPCLTMGGESQKRLLKPKNIKKHVKRKKKFYERRLGTMRFQTN